MRLLPLMPLALAGLVAASAGHADPAFSVTYSRFEAAIAHVDLASCPPTLAGPGRFCRATLNMGQIHVFVFGQDGDQPLLGMESFPGTALAPALALVE